MNIALWVVAAVVATTMLAAGTMKVTRPRSELKANGMAWVDDFPDRTVRTIGALEILAAFVALGRFGPDAF
jgi:DoxX-like family